MKLRPSGVVYRLISTNERVGLKRFYVSCPTVRKSLGVGGKEIIIPRKGSMPVWKEEGNNNPIRSVTTSTSIGGEVNVCINVGFGHHYCALQNRVSIVVTPLRQTKTNNSPYANNARKKFSTKVPRDDRQASTSLEGEPTSKGGNSAEACKSQEGNNLEKTKESFLRNDQFPLRGATGTLQGGEEYTNVIEMMKKKKIKNNEKDKGKIAKICKKGTNGIKLIFTLIKKAGEQIKIIIIQPSILKVYFADLKKNIKHTVVWVKTGVLLFLTNMKISKNLIIKRLKGHRLSYSEYKLLIRTMNDMFKLIPFSFFIIVPFAEFLLPVFLKIYPNLLPSTFKNNDDNFVNIKKNLYAKQQLAKFLQQLIEEKEKQLNENIGIDSEKKKKILLKFHHQLINKDEKDINPFLSVGDTLKIAKIFKDDFVLDQMNLKTLQTICHLLGLKPYGMHYHVVLQLRHHFLRLQREDRELMYEGVDNLKKHTLIEICKDRGMNFNTSEEEMKLQIQQWLELASIKEVPYILLLYIRCVVVTHAIMDIQDTEKVNTATTQNKDVKNATLDDKQKLIQEAKEKLDDLKMKEQEIKKNINKETSEEEGKVVTSHKDSKMKIDFLKKNKYLQNELNLLKQICDLQHTELKIAFTSLTDLAEKKETCDINEVIKKMSERLLDIEKHISELNAHKQIELDEYFYPEEEKTDDVVNIKN
ncbi:LETM1-like protein, putative [Plasmodium knowlesi strain H]|uniref:LETM1-like protein, putative n=3 Tax=Plasmodium knowlesi TaxID=5850 RepID=A0A5K1U5B0_PLAKH|nr:LETM1-like protein, putative [Plasmodium knowlesi strain H]OTN68153.1 putative LETM1-like protein [Plasmodium knowlesi]CAA9986984.1 LETM1-like protein, putative [Plasmodium knowlesi strain H]SBO26622.1 LETM1-like protein, putative [Plasmodium knowlesi strain H]SBO28189.1 LETM1-like protein, putative [Plasmodium knowlesi strain H]VVS76458.1 LETM1-like protein, putative [Plasmodium knowlesi strain H]|eukprot:XP_002258229.1 mitochondrial membrane protein, putative [Plasmodium knowlesi strain H]